MSRHGDGGVALRKHHNARVRSEPQRELNRRAARTHDTNVCRACDMELVAYPGASYCAGCGADYGDVGEEP